MPRITRIRRIREATRTAPRPFTCACSRKHSRSGQREEAYGIFGAASPSLASRSKLGVGKGLNVIQCHVIQCHSKLPCTGVVSPP
jgi:hypothetical protein